jgi:hypothetical protein
MIAPPQPAKPALQISSILARRIAASPIIVEEGAFFHCATFPTYRFIAFPSYHPCIERESVLGSAIEGEIIIALELATRSGAVLSSHTSANADKSPSLGESLLHSGLPACRLLSLA